MTAPFDMFNLFAIHDFDSFKNYPYYHQILKYKQQLEECFELNCHLES